MMILNRCFKAPKFFLAAALSLGIGYMSPAFSQQNFEYSYLIDTNNKTWTRLDLPQSGYGYGDLGFARALNDFGQVTGELYTPTGTHAFGTHAFITGPNGVGIRDLGTFLGAVATSGETINNAGQVAGTAIHPDGYFMDAFITGPNGADPKMRVAPDNRTSPTDINEAGQVVGTTGDKYSHRRS